MMPFGALLHELRTARTATVRAFHGRSFCFVRRTLSQNELARRAGVVPAYVHRAERGVYRQPSRAFVERLAAGLELDDFTAARLLVAAGYWPFDDLDDDQTHAALAVVFAVGNGDWRPSPMEYASRGSSASASIRTTGEHPLEELPESLPPELDRAARQELLYRAIGQLARFLYASHVQTTATLEDLAAALGVETGRPKHGMRRSGQ